eukprot:3037150-Amphidinium_carterae.1
MSVIFALSVQLLLLLGKRSELIKSRNVISNMVQHNFDLPPAKASASAEYQCTNAKHALL